METSPQVPAAEGQLLLGEVSANSLELLFSKDPATITDDELKIIVAEQRAQRRRWDMAEASGAKRAPKALPEPKATKAKKALAAPIDMTGIEL